MDLSFLQAGANWFAVGAGGGGGFFAMKWLFEFFAGRLDKKEAKLDAVNDKLITRLETQLQGVLERLDRVEGELRECRSKHAESEAKVLKLEAVIQAQGEMRQRAAQVVAAERLEGKA